MTDRRLVPLTNDRWGFESSCFVCEEANEAGLRIPFFHDAAAGEVVAEITLDHRFSGAPAYIHGGVSLAILDEAMAWAAIAVGGTWAVTKETTTRFLRPMKVGSTYAVSATVVSRDGDELRCEATITNRGGNPCAEAAATFSALGPAQAVDATGAEVSDGNAGFVQGA